MFWLCWGSPVVVSQRYRLQFQLAWIYDPQLNVSADYLALLLYGDYYSHREVTINAQLSEVHVYLLSRKSLEVLKI